MKEVKRILYITQKVDYNDDLLGAIHSYISSLAQKVERVYIICLYQGENRLPPNCRVLSLGKEKGVGDFGYVFNFYKFVLPLVFKNKIDGIFVHMNEIYVFLLLPLRPVLKIKKIPLIWWKAHAVLRWRARLARFFVDRILTSVSVAFNIDTPKRRIVGQGIDTEKFKPLNLGPKASKKVRAISIGRISPIRNYELLLNAIHRLIKDHPGLDFKLDVCGQIGLLSQESYYQSLLELRDRLGLNQVVAFIGSVPNPDLPKIINQADFVVNPGGSNSLDKSIVEAMACGKIVIDSNSATREILQASNISQAQQSLFLFKRGDMDDLVLKIEKVLFLSPEIKSQIEEKLRQVVVANHNVGHLSGEIIKNFNELL